MYDIVLEVRNLLLGDYTVSSTVGGGNVKVGFQRVVNSFPTIAFYRVGGSTSGRLGYKTAVGGSRDRNLEASIRIDIFTSSTEDLEQLDDNVTKAIFSGASNRGYRLVSNPSMFDDTYDCYRCIQTWLCNDIVQD